MQKNHDTFSDKWQVQMKDIEISYVTWVFVYANKLVLFFFNISKKLPREQHVQENFILFVSIQDFNFSLLVTTFSTDGSKEFRY